MHGRGNEVFVTNPGIARIVVSDSEWEKDNQKRSVLGLSALSNVSPRSVWSREEVDQEIKRLGENQLEMASSVTFNLCE